MKSYFTLIPVCMAAFLSAPAYADYCREFTKSVYVGGRLQQAYGTSCLQPDGAWKIVQQPIMQPASITYVQPVNYVQPVTYYAGGYSRPYYPTTSFFNFSYHSGSHSYRHRGHGWGHKYHRGRGHRHHRHW